MSRQCASNIACSKREGADSGACSMLETECVVYGLVALSTRAALACADTALQTKPVQNGKVPTLLRALCCNLIGC